MSNAPEKAPPKVTWRDTYGWPLGIAGQIAAGAIGAYLYSIVRHQGYIAPFLVGVCVGFGGRVVSNKGGAGMAICAAVLALCGSTVGEWLGAWSTEQTLVFFVEHLSQLSRMTLLLHGAGALIAGWVAWEAPRRG